MKKTKLLKGKALTKKLDQAIRDIFHLLYGENPTCFVCEHKDGWYHPQLRKRGIQVGHYISRRYPVTRWFLPNLFPQCLTKESNLRMFNGKNKSIKDVFIGDKIWGFDEKTIEKQVSIVEDKKEFVPLNLYKVDLENGECFYCTGDHKVFTNKGWVEIIHVLHNVTAYYILEL